MEENNINNQTPSTNESSQIPSQHGQVEQTPQTPEKPTPGRSPSGAAPKSKLKHSIIIGLIVLFLVLIGTASAAYLFVSKPKPKVETPKHITQVSPTPTPPPASGATANWKTYQNPEWEFIIMYPSSWQHKEGSVYDPAATGINSFSIVFGPITNTLEGIAVSPYPMRFLSVGVFSAKDKNKLENMKTCFSDQKTPNKSIFVDNTPALMYPDTSVCGQGDKRSIIYIDHNDKLYEIVIHDSSQTDQILSTFKFTDQNTTSTNQSSCQQDSDCVISDFNPCPFTTKCEDYSQTSYIGVNSKWLQDQNLGKMCMMVMAQCSQEQLTINKHYSAKCINSVCQKVKQ